MFIEFLFFLPETAAQLFDLQLGTSLKLELEWAPEIEEPVPGRVERDCGKPGSAPAGQAAAFAGAHEVTPHRASEGKALKTSQIIIFIYYLLFIYIHIYIYIYILLL